MVVSRLERRDQLITVVRMLMGLGPAIKGDLPKPTAEDEATAQATEDTAKE